MAFRKSLFAIPFAAAAAFGLYGMARADEAAKTPSSPAPTTAEEPKPAAPATKTQSPVQSVLFWVGSQVAPDLSTPCPADPAGEKAWRTWFGGGADVPLAGLRDRLVADGWTADRFVSFFQEMAKGSCPGDCEDCDDEDCDDEDCEKGCGGKCGEKCGGKCSGKCGGKCEGKCADKEDGECCGRCKGAATKTP